MWPPNQATQLALEHEGSSGIKRLFSWELKVRQNPSLIDHNATSLPSARPRQHGTDPVPSYTLNHTAFLPSSRWYVLSEAQEAGFHYSYAVLMPPWAVVSSLAKSGIWIK